MQLVQAMPQQYQQIQALYEEAFPASEKKPFSMIIEGQEKGKVDIWCLQEEETFCGLAITMKTQELVLLDYFAIEKEQRGQGIGAKALQVLQQQYHDRKFFLEIESTLEACDNQEQRDSRKRFYLQNGMQELGLLVKVYGVEMELLGHDCSLTYEEYISVYTQVYGASLLKHFQNLQA